MLLNAVDASLSYEQFSFLLIKLEPVMKTFARLITEERVDSIAGVLEGSSQARN